MSASRWLHRAAFAAVVVGTLVAVGMACFVIFGRVAFPWEIEFMTGSTLDHIERARSGQPIYVEPTSGFIPFLYPPLYYWLVAALGGTTLVARVVSITATFTQGVLVWKTVRALNGSRLWAIAAVGCFAGCFSYVGYWYDLERSDGVVAALVIASAFVLVRWRGVAGALVAGMLAGLACFTKQQAIFYVAGSIGGLVVASRASDARGDTAREVAAFVLGGLVVAFLLLFGVHGDWAAYYLLKMPRAHGLMWSLFETVVGRDLSYGPLLFVTTLGIGVYAFFGMLNRTLARGEIVFSSILLAAFAAALSSRLHIGGFINVLLPWSTFACVAVGFAFSRIERRFNGVFGTIALVAVLFVQLDIWSYDPSEYVPMRKTAKGGQALREHVRELETHGEVLMPSRGHITTPRRFQIAALADVARVEGHSPPDLVSKIKTRHFVAIIDDIRPWYVTPRNDWPPVILEDFEDLRRPLLESYFVADHLDGETFQLALKAPANPVWVYKPRAKPLTPGLDLVYLRSLQLAEMRLAFRRADAKLLGKPEPFGEDEIEPRAIAELEEAAVKRPWLAHAAQKGSP